MPSNNTALEGERNDDAVQAILTGTPFKLRSDEEKLDILKKGRPLIDINIIKRDSSRNCSRSFHSSWYTIHKWLCGSENYNKLFCWPCLLMRPETSSWCSIGNDDTKRFTSLAAKHARCKSHIKAISEYDETLSNFGLPPEFVGGLKFKCKEEEEEEELEGSMSDKTEADDGFQRLYFQDNEREEDQTEIKQSDKAKQTAVDCKEVENDKSKVNTKITFKTWQELFRNNIAIQNSQSFEDSHIYKCKRKILKQELRNAKLIGEKIKFEIEFLKAKIEYYKALKQDLTSNNKSTATFSGTL